MSKTQVILAAPSNAVHALLRPQNDAFISKGLKLAPKEFPRPSTGRRLSTADPQQQKKPLLYHLHTLLLFTWSDIKNILIPQTLLSVVTAVCCSQSSTPSVVLARLPIALAWVWLHLLHFNLANQTQPSSLSEDLANKPWRPLAAQRITRPQARGLFYTLTASLMIMTHFTGGVWESLALMGLFFLYNDLDLGSANILARLLLNALGYTFFALGAVSTLLHSSGSGLAQQGYVWLAILAAVIFSTGQSQDLEDLEGDKATGRRTIPVILGDGITRLSVILPMTFWTIFAPRYWDCSLKASMPVFAIGAVVIKRYAMGNKAEYKKTFRLWNCWVIALYLLPILANH